MLWISRLAAGVLVFLLMAVPAQALITGGEGNEPMQNRDGWPAGSVDVVNQQSRIAWWEGPPFGGGEWHFEYHGDEAALNEALKRLATIKGQRPRLVIYDGKAESFWLGIGKDKEKKHPMEWTFVVWEKENYERLFGQGAGRFMARSPQYGQPLPPPELTVYTGNGLDWSKVKVPEGIDVVDDRLAAHGYGPTDGAVVEVSVKDLASDSPLKAAELVIERRQADPTNSRDNEVTRAEANTEGKIVLKGLPREPLTLTIRKTGYVGRTLDYPNTDQVLWKRYDVSLSPGHRIAGVVQDEKGKPVPNATVRGTEFLTPDGKPYAWLESVSAKTDAEGRFTLEAVPAGSARYYAYAESYVTVGLGEILPTSDKPLTLKVTGAGKMKVTVNPVPQGGYIVNVAPEGGEKIGSWGGGSNLGADGTCEFKQIPPGRYVVHGQPNPGREADRTDPVTVDIKPHETAQVTLKAKAGK